MFSFQFACLMWPQHDLKKKVPWGRVSTSHCSPQPIYGDPTPFSFFLPVSFPLLTTCCCCCRCCCMLCASCGLHCELIEFTNLARGQCRKKKIKKKKIFLLCESNELQESSNECWSQWKGRVELQKGAKIHAQKGRPLVWWQRSLRLTKLCMET